jgi:CBS domain-containing protein
VISDILRRKQSLAGPDLVTLAPTDTVGTLVDALAEHNVGAVVIMDGDDLAGIASERDVVRRLAEHGAQLLEQPIEQIMTTTVVTCSGDDAVDAIARTMTERRIRHMPVLDDGTLVGVVSIGDVVSSYIGQLEHDRGQLEQYISS